MTPRISEAIDIFLAAIEKGTLSKGSCTTCAVGNLVSHGMGIKEIKNAKEKEMVSAWGDAFITSTFGQIVYKKQFNASLVKASIKATKFSIEELMKIEYAFETNTEIHKVYYQYFSKEQIRKDQVKGLEAVIQIMLDFDDCKDLVQDIFTSRVNLIPID